MKFGETKNNRELNNDIENDDEESIQLVGDM